MISRFIFFVMLFISCDRAFAQSHDLNFYLQQGISNSPQLKDFQNQHLQNVQDSLLIRWSSKPQINAAGQLMLAPIINGYGYDEAVSNGGNYMAIVSVSKNLFYGKVLAPQYRDIQLRNLSVGNSSLLSSIQLKKDITQAYITLYADEELINYQQTILAQLKEESEILKTLVEKAVYSQADYYTWTLTIQQREIEMKQKQIQQTDDLFALNQLCGISDTTKISLQKPDVKIQLSPVASSVFFQQFKYDSLQIANKYFLLNNQYKPQLSLYADGGLNSAHPTTLYKNFGTSFGVNFSMPLNNGNQKGFEYQKLKLQEATRNNYQHFFLNQYSSQQLQLQTQIKAADELILQISNSINSSQQILNWFKTQLNAGNIRVTDWLVAYNTILDAKINLADAEKNKMLLINSLNFLNH